MNGHEKNFFEAFRRAEGWIDANPALVPSEVAAQVSALKTLNTSLAACTANQDEEARSTNAASVIIRQRRAELRAHHLVPIARVARSVVHLTPELRVALRVPDRKAHDEALIASASAIASIGEANQQLLVEHGLAMDFITHLHAATSALRQVVDQRGQSRSRGVGATKSVRIELARGRRVLQALDVALSRTLRDNPSRLAEWHTAKRVPRRRTSATTTDTASTPAQAA
jgi:hypothetical protein